MKKLQESTFKGEIGVNLVERLVQQMGHVWRPTSKLDTGFDGDIEIRIGEEVTGSFIKVQVKNGQSYFREETEDSFTYIAESNDIEYWSKSNLPVILIVTKSEKQEAYFQPIKEYIKKHPETLKSKKFLFNKRNNKFDQNCSESLLNLSSHTSVPNIYPLDKTEKLLSNIIPISYYPDRISFGYTEFRKPAEIWKTINGAGNRITQEWFLKDKLIYSFIDLRSREFDSIVDKGTVDSLASEEWSLSDEEDKKRDFARLLKLAVGQKLWYLNFRYNKEYDCYYYNPSKRDLTSRREVHLNYITANNNPSKFGVFNSYGSKKDLNILYYYRHLAFKTEYKVFNEVWYLVLTPTYIFTHDGSKLSRKIDEYLSKIKKSENNSNIARYVSGMGQLLSQNDEGQMFKKYSLLKFSKPMQFEINVGIDENEWSPIDNSKKENENINLDLF